MTHVGCKQLFTFETKMKNLFIIISSIFFLFSCHEDDKEISVDAVVVQYLSIAHTRENTNPFMDSSAEQIDYSKYDMLWLGGDLAYLTSVDDVTMSHLDSILNFESSTTLWALGNHDYSNLERIQNYTNKPPYYSTNRNGITFLVLDTQDSLSNIVGMQKELVEDVLDTIQNSSYLVVLHHKLIWMYGNPDLETQMSTIPNGDFGNYFHCINPNNFYDDIYPKLVDVTKRGIEVICIAGDIGGKAKQFEYITDDGIYFLASGIDAGKKGNLALVFNHDVSNKKLEWEFVSIENL